MKPKPRSFHNFESSFEGDGILETFYPLLWTKDPAFGTITSVYIPDTVIIEFDKPKAWYFMHKGLIKMKSRDNLNMEKIKEIFLKKVPECGVVGCFITTHANDNGTQENVFNYMDKAEFTEFIDNKSKLKSGILQRFVQPRGEHNFVIRAVWSPKTVFFEKRESNKKINDLSYDLYERVLTYEAQDFYSKAVPLTGYVLPNNIERICYNISSHISNVSYERCRVARLVLNFKIDPKGRIWLLYCSSLRLEKGFLVDKSNSLLQPPDSQGMVDFTKNYIPSDLNLAFRPPDHITSDLMTTIGKPLNLHKTFKCMKCLNNFDQQHVYEVNFKTLIDGFEYNHLGFMKRKDEVKYANPTPEQRLEEEERQKKFDDFLGETKGDFRLYCMIPQIIKNIYPKMRTESYQILKYDLSFLKTTTTVCEDCMIEIGDCTHGHLLAKFSKNKEEFFGCGRLRPENLIERQKNTMLNIEVKNEVEEQAELISGDALTGLDKEAKIYQKLHEFRSKRGTLADVSPTNERADENLNDLKPGTAYNFSTSIGHKKLELENQIIARKFKESAKKRTSNSKFINLGDVSNSMITPMMLPASTNHQSEKHMLTTKFQNKFLEDRLTGFLSRKENSVSAMSTKTSSLYFHSRKSSMQTTGFESLHVKSTAMTPNKQSIDNTMPTKLPKMQYLKSFYSSKSSSLASISTDQVDRFIESQIIPSEHLEPKKNPLSFKIKFRSASQKAVH